MLVTAAVLESRATMGQLAKNWFATYAGNFAGALLLALTVAQTGVLDNAGAAATAAVAKTSLTWMQARATRCQ